MTYRWLETFAYLLSNEHAFWLSTVQRITSTSILSTCSASLQTSITISRKVALHTLHTDTD